MRTRRSILLYGGAALVAGAGAAGYRWWHRRPAPPRPQPKLPVVALSQLDHERVFDACIVGGGIAGAVLGAGLARAGLHTVLLECGLAPQEPMDERFGRPELFKSSGSIDYPLLATRVRTLGGTTSVWTGNCYRHLPPVFDDNPHAVDGAWPVSYAEMEPWYEMAEETLRVRSRGVSSFAPPRRSPLPPLRSFSGNPELEGLLRRADIEAERAPRSWVAHYREPVRALHDLLPDFAALSTSTLVTGAAVRRIEMRDDGTATAAVCSDLSGAAKRIRAQRFVIAAGAVESARLLLLSGIGARNDHVGRYFMEDVDFLFSGHIPGYSATRSEYTGSLQFFADAMRRGLGGIALQAVQSPDAPDRVRIGFGFSMEPSRENRVTLAADMRDPFGDPVVDLHLGFSEHDQRTIEAGNELVRDVFRRLGGVDLDKSPVVRFDHHHLGAARMSRTPESGVVDRDLRVHGTQNLYVASSGVFCTAGSGHPTLLLTAFCHRLGKTLTGSS